MPRTRTQTCFRFLNLHATAIANLDLIIRTRQQITEDNTCVINAWDGRSFIGNQGIVDYTINGRMVTGSASNRVGARVVSEREM